MESARGKQHDEQFAEAALRLTGAAEKPERAAGVGAPGEALVAFPAGHGGLDRHAVAGLDAGHRGADGLDHGGGLVADPVGVLDDLAPDFAGFVVMNVGTANSDDLHSQQNVGVVFYHGIGRFDRFHPVDAREDHGFHVCLPLFSRQLPPI